MTARQPSPLPASAPDGWSAWSPTVEQRPDFAVDAGAGIGGAPALRIAAGDRARFGAWRRDVGAVVPGRWYHAVAHLRAEALDHPREQAFARVRWMHPDEGCFPEYLLVAGQAGSWTRLELLVEAPEGATGASLELALRRTAGGSVRWSGVEFTPAAPPAPRPVRIAALHHRRHPSSGPAETLARFVADIAPLAPGEVDLLCLPEGLANAGNDASFAQVAEPIPGPTSKLFAAQARRLRANLVVGLYERADGQMRNTAALFDREGRLVGTYRKTHLPQNESDGGIAPGDGFPVFATDVGRIGLMICWDVQFAEPARRLADAGAEIICMPIAGGSEILARARAIENHVHLVASSFDLRSMIVDPLGAIVAQTDGGTGLVRATVDLTRRHRGAWVGDFRGNARVERRSDA